MFGLTTTSKLRPINPGALSFTSQQMARLGAFSIDRIRDRAARGIGSNDAPMKPLNAGYAKYKARWGVPVRNLIGTGRDGGHMLDNITVRNAQTNSVRIDITSQKARVKAASNERRSPWYGWSAADASAILDLAMQAAHGNISEIIAERGLSVWMDPLRLRSIGFRTKGDLKHARL